MFLFVLGLGCGLVYAATVTITCQYFDKRRGLALGIVTTGMTHLTYANVFIQYRIVSYCELFFISVLRYKCGRLFVCHYSE